MITCKFHHRLPAAWYCQACHTQFCTTCVPGGEENFRPGQPRCLLCSAPLVFRDDDTHDEPFWRISSRFFRYPFALRPLALVLVVALLSEPGGMLMLLLWLFANLTLMRYAIEVIRSVARDQWQPPSVSKAMRDEEGLLTKQLVVFAVFVGLGLVLSVKAPLLGWVLTAFGALALPASVMALAMTESVVAAFNPVLLIQMMRVAGLAYVFMWFAFITVTSAPELVLMIMQGSRVQGLGLLLGALGAYTTLVAAAMMGYLLYQHRQQFGIQIPGRRGRSLPVDEFQVKTALGSAHVYVQTRRFDDARKALEQGLHARGADPALQERLFRLALLSGGERRKQTAVMDYLRFLFAQSQDGRAAEAWLEALAELPELELADPAWRHRLGAALARRGRWREARRLLVNLHKQDPAYPGLGEAYLTLSRVYLDGFEDRANAEKLYRFVADRFAAVMESDEARELALVLDTQ